MAKEVNDMDAQATALKAIFKELKLNHIVPKVEDLASLGKLW